MIGKLHVDIDQKDSGTFVVIQGKSGYFAGHYFSSKFDATVTPKNICDNLLQVLNDGSVTDEVWPTFIRNYHSHCQTIMYIQEESVAAMQQNVDRLRDELNALRTDFTDLKLAVSQQLNL